MCVAGAGRGEHEGVHLEAVLVAGHGEQLVLGVHLAAGGGQGVVTRGAPVQAGAVPGGGGGEGGTLALLHLHRLG